MLIIVCLVTVISSVAAKVPTLNQQYGIVGFLAQLRSSVEPPASNMNFVRYSLEMQALANDWASRCSNTYPNVTQFPQFKGTGMTIQTFYNKRPRFSDVSLIANEASNYNYDRNRCNGVCRNYKTVSSTIAEPIEQM
uniref:SCP domain-containing protein n=1 Tax=Mesocestoides corti TaxID=53468 RepID=A0A5K3FZG7_MESCO